MPGPVEDAEHIVRRSHRRRLWLAALIAFAVVLASSWVWTTRPGHAAEPSAPAVTVTATHPHRAGYEWVTHKPPGCYSWVAGWVEVKVSCDRHPLPGWFKRTVGGTVTGCMLGVAFTPGGLLAGCVGGLAGSIKWD